MTFGDFTLMVNMFFVMPGLEPAGMNSMSLPRSVVLGSNDVAAFDRSSPNLNDP